MKKYNSPQVVIIDFSLEDVIRTSLIAGNADDEMEMDFGILQ